MKVNFARNHWDRKVKILSKLRFTTRVIAEHVPLTEGQIGYRRTLLNGGIMYYRRGLSPDAKRTLARIDKLLGDARDLRRMIQHGW